MEWIKSTKNGLTKPPQSTRKASNNEKARIKNEAQEYLMSKMVKPIINSSKSANKQEKQLRALIKPFTKLLKEGDLCNYMTHFISIDKTGIHSKKLEEHGFESFETVLQSFKDKFKDYLNNYTKIADFVPGTCYPKVLLQTAINNYNRQGGMLNIRDIDGKKTGVFLFDYKNKDEYTNNYNEESKELTYELKRAATATNIKTGLNHIIINNMKPIYAAQKIDGDTFEYLGEFTFTKFANETENKFVILTKKGEYDEAEKLEEKDIENLITVINNSNLEEAKTTVEQLIKVRIGQGIFRDKLMKKYNNKCCISSIDVKELLIASHILSWKDSNNNERWDENNGLLLCSHYDKLFDKHLISFAKDGKIIISNSVPTNVINKFKLNTVKIEVNPKMERYMSRHRENLK